MRKTVLNVMLILGATTPALAETIVVRSSECRQLVQSHAPGAADYQPGVDVRGKAVAPADVGGGYGLAMPDAIDVQIGIDLADRLSRRAGESQRKVLPYEGKAPLGTLTIKGQEASWNGQRLMPADQAALAEACRQSLDHGPLPTRKPQ